MFKIQAKRPTNFFKFDFNDKSVIEVPEDKIYSVKTVVDWGLDMYDDAYIEVVLEGEAGVWGLSFADWAILKPQV